MIPLNFKNKIIINNNINMESNYNFDYEQYEWINYFYEGFDVESFNNLIDSSKGNNNLNNFPIQMNLKSKKKFIKLEKSKINNNIINNNNKISVQKKYFTINIPENNKKITFENLDINQFNSKKTPLENRLGLNKNSFYKLNNNIISNNSEKQFNIKSNVKVILKKNKNEIIIKEKKSQKLIEITPRVFVIIKEKEKK